MAWTTPRTWVTGETVTAALMNAHVRDNFRETSPFTVTTAGDLSYADAANSMNSRLGIGSAGKHPGIYRFSAPVGVVFRPLVGDTCYLGSSSGGTITSFQPLNGAGWGSGTNVTVTVTTGTQALVLFGCQSVPA